MREWGVVERRVGHQVGLGGLFGPNGQLTGTGIRSEGGGLYRSGRRDASPWKQEALHMKLMIGTHKPCKYIGSCPPSQICADPPNSALESLRPSHWKAIIFVPGSLRHRKLRHSESRVPQVPWLCCAGRENRKNMPPSSIFLSVCGCVCLHVCILYSVVIEHEIVRKILFEVDESAFQMDFQLFTSCVHGWRKSYTTWEHDHLSHSFFVFLCNKVQFIWSAPEFHPSPVSFETVSVAA